jgi:hypothetical protein
MSTQRSGVENFLIRQGQKRVLTWIVGSGLGVLGPFFLILLAVVVAAILLAGMGEGSTALLGPDPPAIATVRSRPMEWLVSASLAARQDSLSNALVMAVMQQASDGQVYGDRYDCANGQTAGEGCAAAFGRGVKTLGIAAGLLGLNSGGWPVPADAPLWKQENLAHPHSVAENLATGVAALARSVQDGSPLQTSLARFHAAYQLPAGFPESGNYSAQIKAIVWTDQSPHLGAWALAPWNAQSGAWEDPHGRPVWVFVVGSAPVGAPFQYVWQPPTVTRVCDKNGCRVQVTPHDLHGHDLALPQSVWAETPTGRVAFMRVTPQSSEAGSIPVWPGGSVYAARLPLTHPFQIVAQWAGGARGLTTLRIPFPEQAGSPAGSTSFVAQAQVLQEWQADIEQASAATGVPARWIAAEMVHESGGSATAGTLAGAYGLMQLEPGTEGATNADRENPASNLLYGARLLAANAAIFHSWRLASAAYYGGAGLVESALAAAGLSWPLAWAQAQGALNIVPDPQYGNTLTLAQYADSIEATSQSLAGTSQTGGAS